LYKELEKKSYIHSQYKRG